MTLPTIKAKYIVMMEAMKEALWLKGLAKGLKVQDQIVRIITQYNKVYDERTKHVDVKLYFVRE